MRLINRSQYDNSTLKSFGFSCGNKDESLVVQTIYEGFDALNIGDKIIEVEGNDYQSLTQEQWCDILQNGLVPEEKQEISIEVIRDDQQLEFVLKKMSLL